MMKLDRDAARAALALCVEPTRKGETLARQCVRIDAKAGKARIEAADQELAVAIEIDAEGDGEIALPAAQLLSLLKELQSDSVTIEAQDGRANIVCDDGRFELVGPPVSEMQAFPAVSGRPVRCSGEALVRAIRATSSSMAKDETRYAINGAKLEFEGDSLRMVTTDGRRLTLAEVSASGADKVDAVVPARWLRLVAKVAGDAEQVELRFDDRRACFSHNGYQISTQLLENRFPEYRGLIEVEEKTKVEVRRMDLLRGCKRLNVVAGKDVPVVHLDLEEGQDIAMSAETSDVGRGDTKADAEISGAPLRVGMNPTYLADALQSCDGESVTATLNDEAMPMLWELGGGIQFVLMPITEG